MRLPYSFLRLFLLCVIISTQAKSQEVNLSTVVATVNNSQITIGHVIAVKKQLPDQYQKLGYDILFEGILDLSSTKHCICNGLSMVGKQNLLFH